jgi:protein quaking
MALVGNSSFLDQDGLEHGSPLSAGTLMNNGSPGDLNGWGGDVMLFV